MLSTITREEKAEVRVRAVLEVSPEETQICVKKSASNERSCAETVGLASASHRFVRVSIRAGGSLSFIPFETYPRELKDACRPVASPRFSELTYPERIDGSTGVWMPCPIPMKSRCTAMCRYGLEMKEKLTIPMAEREAPSMSLDCGLRSVRGHGIAGNEWRTKNTHVLSFPM